MDVSAEGQRLLEAGRHAEAITLYEAAAKAEQEPERRAHVLAMLSSALSLVDHLDEAVAVARGAVGLACSASDERAEAHARLSLGTALVLVVRAGHAGESTFSEAMDSLERAASVYQGLGMIDFATALITMAEGCREIGELDPAEGLYARVIHELSDARWAVSEALMLHANHVRGRAFAGLGFIELDRDRATPVSSEPVGSGP